MMRAYSQAHPAIPRAVLVVDDDRAGREALAEAVAEMGYEVTSAAAGAEALDILGQYQINIVLTELKMPGMDGLELLTRTKRIRPDAFVILVTAFATVDTAVEAMKRDAYDCIVKPADLRQLRALLDRASQARDLLIENQLLKEQLRESNDFPDIIGQSSAIRQALDRVRHVAQTTVPMLLQGEIGTGKGLLANAVHANSRQRNGPFVKVDCSAVPPDLFEAELFGHERGAFTHAFDRRTGRLEAAHCGTLFLDAIAEIPFCVQRKLIRVLQDSRFERIGGTETLRVDVRIITATNASLPERIKAGRFREDLYYRLAVITILVPPLRDRREDIPLLVSHFVRLYASRHRKDIRGVSAEAMNTLTTYSWPGNVRELQNCIETMVVMSGSTMLGPELLPTEMQQTTVASDQIGFPIGLSMRQIEEKAIRETLASVGGNRKRAAGILGISLRTLHRKITEYGIDRIHKG